MIGNGKHSNNQKTKFQIPNSNPDGYQGQIPTDLKSIVFLNIYLFASWSQCKEKPQCPKKQNSNDRQTTYYRKTVHGCRHKQKKYKKPYQANGIWMLCVYLLCI